MSKVSLDKSRRSFMNKLLIGSSAMVVASQQVSAEKKSPEAEEEELRFPGEEADHKVVYQFNKADEDYHKAVLFSVGAMLRKYGDNIHIVVTAIGPGIHILAKNPKRPVSKETKERVSSLALYGVEFHACGNTLKSLKWTEKDVLDFAEIVEVGAADLMELQEQGYSYLSW